MAIKYLDAKRVRGEKGTNSDWISTTGWTFGSNKHTVNNSTASVNRKTYYDCQSEPEVQKNGATPAAWVEKGTA